MPAQKEAQGGGKRLRDARDRLGLSQTELGQRIGASQNRISDWETGDSYPTLIQCKRIALALGRSYTTVTGWWEPEDDSPAVGPVTSALPNTPADLHGLAA